MIEYLFQGIALIAYLACSLRMICFNRNGAQFHRGYAWLAALLIAACLGQSLHILLLQKAGLWGLWARQGRRL